MTDYVWKHLPFAIYLDTNALRSVGLNLDAQWINELLSITNKYGICVCISELVLSEWCEHVTGVLEGNRQKLLSSMTLLSRYGVAVPNIKPSEIGLPVKSKIIAVVTEMMRSSGFDIIPNWDAPLPKILNEAVTKRPPFEQGGKGLCDAVILESYAEHAKKNFTGSRVIVISKDTSVKRSAQRFSDREINVDFVNESEIITKLKSMLSDELAAYLETKKINLKNYVLEREAEILDFVKKTPLEITDLTINPPSSTPYDGVFGTVESILSVNPIKVIDVIGGAPTYGEQTETDRYPLRISIEIELEIIVTESRFRGGLLGLEPQSRVVVQPDALSSSSPVAMEKKSFDWNPREINKTIRRAITVFATLDAHKAEKDVFDDLRLEKVF